MIPLPCDPHKICVGYAIKNGKNILPVTGKIPREMITEQKGTIAFEQDKEFIKTVVHAVTLDTALGENIINKESVKRKLFCCWPEFIAPEDMTYERVFRIVIMEFTDIYNFDSTNIKRECNFMIEPGKVIPFSTYNMGLSRSSEKPNLREKLEAWKKQAHFFSIHMFHSTIKRTKRRTLALQIDHEGNLIIRAPNRMPMSLIEEFIAQKIDWIKKHQKRIQEKNSLQPQKTYNKNEFLTAKKELQDYLLLRVRMLWENTKLPPYTSLKVTHSNKRW